MLNPKKLAIALFASLGVNIFLGGLVGGQMLSATGDAPGQAIPAKPKALSPEKTSKTKPPEHVDRRTLRDQRGPRGAPRGNGPPDGPPPGGSDDLMLLRQMVRIMGGPEDARIKELREARKPDIEEMRDEMKDAHERVHQALTADPLAEVDVQEALKHLRKTTFEAQARAQEGIVKLAVLMTAEEREKLRKFKPPGPHERRPHHRRPDDQDAPRDMKPGQAPPRPGKGAEAPGEAPAP